MPILRVPLFSPHTYFQVQSRSLWVHLLLKGCYWVYHLSLCFYQQQSSLPRSIIAHRITVCAACIIYHRNLSVIVLPCCLSFRWSCLVSLRRLGAAFIVMCSTISISMTDCFIFIQNFSFRRSNKKLVHLQKVFRVTLKRDVVNHSCNTIPEVKAE